MKVLYFDPILGVSGDMILATLIDLGVPQDYLRKKLNFVPNFRLKVARIKRHGVSAKNVQFKINKRIKANRFIPLIKKVDGITSVIKYCKELGNKREKLDYEIDGVVIKVNSLKKQKEFRLDRNSSDVKIQKSFNNQCD